MHEHSGVPGRPIEVVDRIERIIITAPVIDRRPTELGEDGTGLQALAALGGRDR